MKRNKTLLCLLIMTFFMGSFLLVPYLNAQEPKINVTITPKSDANKAKAETPKSISTKGKISGENQPVISIDAKLYDAGEVWEGDVVIHSFIVKNTGKSELNISNVKPG
jgi:hypothetical protein